MSKITIALLGLVLGLGLGLGLGTHAQVSGSVSPDPVGTPQDSAAAQAAPITAQTLADAIARGNLDQVLTDGLGANPTFEQIAALQQALAGLTKSSPADAAMVAQAVTALAHTFSNTNPQAAVDLAVAAVTTLSDPDVVAAAPDIVAQGIASAQSAVEFARQAAVSIGVTLTGTAAVTSDAVAVAQAQATARSGGDASTPGQQGGAGGQAAGTLLGAVGPSSGHGGGGTASIAAP